MKNSKLDKIEIREALSILDSNDGVKRITGKIPFNTRSFDLGGYFEVINPTAFNKTLADGADVKLLYNHDTSKVLARVKNNSLTLRTLEDGLEFEAILNNTSFANDVYENIRTGNVNTLSFGFNVINDEWKKEDGNEVRVLKEVKLVEISAAVAFPAYPNTYSETRGIVLDKLESILSKQDLTDDDYLTIDNTIKALNSLIPKKEEREEEAIVTKVDEESPSTNDTLDFLSNLLAECKK